MGRCGCGKRASLLLSVVHSLRRSEALTLDTLRLRLRVGLRMTRVNRSRSEALTWGTLRLRLRVGGGYWPPCRATPAACGEERSVGAGGSWPAAAVIAPSGCGRGRADSR